LIHMRRSRLSGSPGATPQRFGERARASPIGTRVLDTSH
jgi:hypothetical protein